MVPMKRTLIILAVLMGAPVASSAASLAKDLQLLPIGGTTLDEIERELDRAGSHGREHGQRHPGQPR